MVSHLIVISYMMNIHNDISGIEPMFIMITCLMFSGSRLCWLYAVMFIAFHMELMEPSLLSWKWLHISRMATFYCKCWLLFIGVELTIYSLW